MNFTRNITPLALLMFAFSVTAGENNDDPTKLRTFLERMQRGEPLTTEEQAALQRMRDRMGGILRDAEAGPDRPQPNINNPFGFDRRNPRHSILEYGQPGDLTVHQWTLVRLAALDLQTGHPNRALVRLQESYNKWKDEARNIAAYNLGFVMLTSTNNKTELVVAGVAKKYLMSVQGDLPGLMPSSGVEP